MEDDASRPVPDVSEPVEAPAAESEQLPPPPTAEDLEKSDHLIRQANLAKIRGDKVAFEKLIEEAAQVSPGSSAVQEAVGDAYLERRQVRKAKEAFQMAVKLDSSNASAERKFGEAVLSIQLALDPMFGREPSDESLASGKAAVLLSFLIPGLGQIVGGETSKGSAFLITWLVGVIGAIIVPGGLAGFMTLFGMRGPVFNPVVLLPLFLAATAWMWAIGDAGGKAKRQDKRAIVRPVPPVDKEFEL